MSDDRIVRNVADLIAKPANKPGTPRQKVYGVPRRFGMGTIFVVMTAFALLFSVLTSGGLPGEYVLFLAGFLAVIGIAQALLFGGKRPRAASMVTGATLTMVPTLAWLLYFVIQESKFTFTYLGDISALSGFYARVLGTIFSTFLAGTFGALLGYVGGGVVAGVFLIMDYVERGLYGRRNEAGGERSETSDP